MYAKIDDTTTTSARSSAARPTRATLQTRPHIQRTLIRSWEYIRPVRIGVLIVRLLVVLWLIILGAVLMSSGYASGWVLLPAAAAVAAFGIWVFSTAAKGWPAAKV
jgi:hypothetical protein